jgi:hypothetical protein
MIAPVAFARRSIVPSKNIPNKLPKGNDATVNPVSSNDPHGRNPNAINTAPQTSVILRESCKNFAGSLRCPAASGKSRMLEAASEFSEPLAFDIATAMIDANISPARPTGISRAKKIGRIFSSPVRSPWFFRRLPSSATLAPDAEDPIDDQVRLQGLSVDDDPAGVSARSVHGLEDAVDVAGPQGHSGHGQDGGADALLVGAALAPQSCHGGRPAGQGDLDGFGADLEK